MFNKMLYDGFKFVYIPKRTRKTFYALKSGGFFNNDTDYYEFKTENAVEVNLLKLLPRNVFIPIENLVQR